ncbi:MAG: hypothetical protein QXT33_02030 [Thermofilum sp.]
MVSLQRRVAMLRRFMGVLTLAVVIAGGYFSYKIYAYIVNLEPGSLESYQSWMSTLIYLLFILSAAYVLISTYERRARES